MTQDNPTDSPTQRTPPSHGYNPRPYQATDPGTYRYPASPMSPQPIPHSPTFPPPAPQRKSHKARNWLIGIGLAIFLVCGGTAGILAAISSGAKQIEKQIEEGDATKMKMVKITACKPDTTFDTVEISFTVTNTSDETLTFIPDFNILTKDGTQVGETSGLISDLEAGKTAADKALASVSSFPKGGISCQLESVN